MAVDSLVHKGDVYRDCREKMKDKISREKASELMEDVSPAAIEKIETGKRKPTPYEVVQLSKCYHAPELCNYFCRNSCDIGKELHIQEVSSKHLSQITVKILSALNTMQDHQKKLLEITEDEIIEDKEIADFIKIRNDLDKISASVESFKMWANEQISSGVINKKKYDIIKDRIEKNMLV